MFMVEAISDIACMPHFVTVWNRTVGEFPRYSMNKLLLFVAKFVRSNHAVPVLVQTSGEEDAVIRRNGRTSQHSSKYRETSYFAPIDLCYGPRNLRRNAGFLNSILCALRF